MSQLTSFTADAAAQSFAVIGEETITIGGVSYLAVLNEAAAGREYNAPGFDPENTLRAVLRVASCPAGDLLGKIVQARGTGYRVASQSRGVGFLTLELQDVNRT